ncbi:protein kinase domain-containing protein [Streptomyces sp. MI02-7b]|uniref:protein kinase domain-containing protein n=1 Tax=Streptomyces sp. MI02-7b TaxID=462941 RepID=UPI0029B21D64|nr:PQQ-binding-like beta-propeller repeat protein [Streptomyces sp. MI02-7b]MDX3077040.1 PQQ-binding-like beta-propeller repeat protein [Streptomyces sp. MI02-7b]
MDDRDLILADRYRLVRPLGSGGMGEVWEGHDATLRRPVAVKVISVLAGGGSRADEARARFLREARITAALQHPHIVTVHDLGEAPTGQGTTPFLVMELLRGEGLDAVVRRGPVAEEDVAHWGAQVCDALGEAHAAGILHRDIKPANLFVAASGRSLKVLDFGIARAADASATGDRLTHTGFVVGTAAYMAPEQARGRPEQRSDLYSLGCVLFELLTGRLPFDAPDSLGYVTAHLHDPAPAPSSIAPGVSAPWDRLVGRLLAKDPRERYASAAVLAGELRRVGAARQAVPATRRHTPTVADSGASAASSPPSAASLPGDPAAVATVRAPAEPPAGSGVSRRSLLRSGAGAAAGVVAAGAAAVYLFGDPTRDPVAWSQSIADVDVYNSDGPDVVVADGRCHVGAGHYYKKTAALHTFDLATGKPLWKLSLDAAWAREARFTVVGGTVLALTEDPADKGGLVQAFDAATGERRWGRSVSYGAMGLDVHRPSGLLIIERDGYVTGIDPRTGDERWAADVSSPYGATSLLAGDLIVCGDGTALLGRTGKKLWTRSGFEPLGDSAQSLGEGLLCYEAGKAVPVDLVCRKADTGEVMWRSPFQTTEPDAFVVGALQPLDELVSGTTVFLPLAAGSRRKPTALDGLTGEQAWTYGSTYEEVGLEARATTSVAGGFVLSTGSGLVCLAADDGRQRWHADTRWVQAAGTYALLSRKEQARVFRHWTSVRIVGAENGRTLWTGEFDGTAVSEPGASGDSVVVLDAGGTVWAIHV